MSAIFFDLETTDKSPIGQIINYSFISVSDKDLQPQRELSGLIRLSRLQLPSPGAILANRTDVVQHQQRAQHSERQAVELIVNFIDQEIRAAGRSIYLVGFNSNSFDLNFLRTTLIRNGLNPYFGGKIIYRDLLLGARWLSCSNPTFPRESELAASEGAQVEPKPENKNSRLSLRLETLSRALGLLQGVQSHESREDVLLTLELAKALRQRFAFDILKFDAYQAQPAHAAPRSGEIIYSMVPQYDLTLDQIHEQRPLVLLDAIPRSALWIDLKDYAAGKGRAAIRWTNPQKHSLFVAQSPVRDQDFGSLAQQALSEFSKVKLSNWFTTSVCDIEADIYRLDFDAINRLRRALWQRDKSAIREINNPDLQTIYQRHVLANYIWGNGKDDRVIELLKHYGRYRYGGKMLLRREGPAETEEQARDSDFAPSWLQLSQELEERRAKEQGQSRILLDRLKDFYEASDIVSSLGKELTTGQALTVPDSLPVNC